MAKTKMMKKNCHDEWIEMSEEEIIVKKRTDQKLLKILFPEMLINKQGLINKD